MIFLQFVGKCVPTKKQESSTIHGGSEMIEKKEEYKIKHQTPNSFPSLTSRSIESGRLGGAMLVVLFQS